MIVVTVGYFWSCKSMDSTYEEFVVPNGLKYPQKPDSLKVFAGYNKLRLTWLQAKDPSIVRAEIYWNNYLDTLKVDIPANQEIITIDVPNLGENTYTFYVKTYDAEGNASIPSEVTGTAYGENYVVSATDRTVASATRNASNEGTIKWNARTSDLVYSEVRYVTGSGAQKTIRILPGESTLTCPDIKPGEKFEYRSVFLPSKGIDSVAREWITYENPFFYMYPRTGWVVESRNGNHPWGDGGGGTPDLILDGNIATGWHSRTGTDMPQCIAVDMQQPLSIHHITVYPPSNAGWRYLKNMSVYLSDTPITPDVPQPSWGEPVAKVLFPGGESITIDFPSVLTGRYLVILFLDSTSNTYISVMELEVYSY